VTETLRERERERERESKIELIEVIITKKWRRERESRRER
jgi:hypothetical protein